MLGVLNIIYIIISNRIKKPNFVHYPVMLNSEFAVTIKFFLSEKELVKYSALVLLCFSTICFVFMYLII
jgi:hypothetical protein